MTRFSRIRRRPDHWATPHERARSRAAERLDGPLGLAEAAWLEEHLASCASCTAVTKAYDADRLALRSMRDATPEPPRDLWARTAAGIERESAARGRMGPQPGGRRAARVPLAALSGIAVIAVVVSVSLASVGFGVFDLGTDGVKGEDTPAASSDTVADASDADPTPMAVRAGAVAWIGGANGSFAYNDSAVNEVCPPRDPDCATLRGGTARQVAQLSTAPRSVIRSTRGQTIVEVDDGDNGGQRLIVVALPEPTATEPPVSPSASSQAAASEAPTASPGGTSTIAPSTDPSSTPATSNEPSGPSSSTDPSIDPSSAPASFEPSGPPASSEPSAEASVEPSVLPSASPSVGTTASPTPEPTIAASLAIASGVELVGEGAAFSEDGDWFAFTARPAGGSAGPDVHVWRVGDATSRQLTTDGVSVLASWDGGRVIVSRPGADDLIEGATSAVSVAIDPETGTESAVGDTWRPVADPSGDRAVAWTGSIRPSADALGWAPAVGRLELRDWSHADGAVDGGSADEVITDGPMDDFDVRWDESGEWFGVWVSDPSDPGIGRLSLYHVDPDTSELADLDGAPVDVKALPGFSIGDGRLAWATPPGQGGEGSRIQIAAWDGDQVGTVESVPGEDIIVVR